MMDIVEALNAEARAQTDEAASLLRQRDAGSPLDAAIRLGIANALYGIASRLKQDGLAGRGA